MEENERQAEVMREWYFNKQKIALYWEILKDIRRHETAFVSDDITNRYYKLGSIRFLGGQIKARFMDSHYHRFHFFKSMELLKFTKMDGIHFIPVDLRTEWNPYGIMLAIDIDCRLKDTRKASIRSHKEAKKITKYLDGLNVTFIVNNSGSKGFHVRIGWNELSKVMGFDTEGVKNLAKFICDKSGVNTKPSKTNAWGDVSIIHDRGLIRVLLSLHPKSLLVALPLTRELFENFDINITKPNYIMENFNLRNWIERAVWNPKGNVDMLFKEFEEGGA